MTFRNRPTLDRRHRPRWQDELRSQQLIVAGFAVAIAIAIGIFGATEWNSFYDAHLREIASVGNQAYDQDQLDTRTGVLAAALYAKYSDLGKATGGANDSYIQQQIQAVQTALNDVQANALDSLTSGAYMRAAAVRLGISVSDGALDKEIVRRTTLSLRLQLSVITVNALPNGSAAGATPTPAQWAAAEARAKDLMAQLKGGASFPALAKSKSADSTTAATNGLVGWVEDGDPTYGPYFTAAKNGKAGDVIGPVKGDLDYAILRVDAVRAAGTDTQLKSLLTSFHATDADLREYIRDELLRNAYQDYFGSTVLSTYMPQRNVAQIVIEADGGPPNKTERIRHILIQPEPGNQDQSAATPAEWAAALKRAQAVRADLVKPNADWTKLAAEFSNDPGSASYGGDLGWYNPSTASSSSPGGTLDPDFVSGMAKLKLDEVSPPVKTQFGYHLIQVFEQRTSADDQATRVAAEVKKDPSTFAAVAKRESSDTTTAPSGGGIGWVAPWEKDAILEKAIFALTTKGQISDPITDTDGQVYIFQLLDTSAARYMDSDRLSSLKSSGYPRWRDGVKAQIGVWTAPGLTSTASG